MVAIKNGLLTKAEAANLLGISFPTLEKLVRQTDIPCTKIGRKYVFSGELLTEWIVKRSSEKTGIEVKGA
jgi:excisionase family DNA binding protein